ncbi:MAG: MFS transporter [Chloroflexota bacterium]|jgi:MFS family permease
MQSTSRFHPILRRLLRLDQPVPERTEAEVTAERDRNYRWNFAVNLGDVSTFWVGLSFISSATIVPLYISKLTDSALAIGLAAVIARGSWFLPQIFTANFVEMLPRKKPMIVNLGFFLERLPMWVILLSPLLALWNPLVALLAFFIGYAWHGFGAGVVATSWQDLIARCFPVERRGRFMGTSFFVGSLTGAAGAAVSAYLLTNLAFPNNFFYCFLIAAAAITISWFFLSQTREPVGSTPPPRKSNRDFWHELPKIVRQDDNYRRFLIARWLLALSGMGIGFVTVAAVRRWAVSDGTAGGYTAAFLLGQMAGNLVLGLLADRSGHKRSLEAGALTGFLAFGLAWLAPDPQYYFLAFFLLGVTEGAIIVSGILVVMEFSPPEKRPTYAGLTNTTVGVISMAGPLIGAWLAIAGYDWLFAASAIISLLALVALHWWVKEPRFAGLADQVASHKEQGAVGEEPIVGD